MSTKKKTARSVVRLMPRKNVVSMEAGEAANILDQLGSLHDPVWATGNCPTCGHSGVTTETTAADLLASLEGEGDINHEPVFEFYSFNSDTGRVKGTFIDMILDRINLCKP